MNHALELTTLESLVAIVDAGSVAQAAERLHLTQSAVSKRLQALETRVGQPLMDRVGRRLQLTEAGTLLLPRARALLAQAREAQAALDRLGTNSQALTGTFKIATSHHIGLHRLPAVLRGFVSEHPGIDLRIAFVDSEDGCRSVDRGESELAVVTLPRNTAAWPNLKLHPIWRDTLICVVGAGHPLATEQPTSLRALAAHPAILPDANTFTHRHVAEAVARAQVELNVRMQTNYLETIKMLVGAGLGWSALPATMLDDSLTQLPVMLHASRDLGVVTHGQRTASRAAKAFMTQLWRESSHRSSPAAQ